jgi:hypothetical protein
MEFKNNGVYYKDKELTRHIINMFVKLGFMFLARDIINKINGSYIAIYRIDLLLALGKFSAGLTDESSLLILVHRCSKEYYRNHEKICNGRKNLNQAF